MPRGRRRRSDRSHTSWRSRRVGVGLSVRRGNLFTHTANPVFAGPPFTIVALPDRAPVLALRKLGRHVRDQWPRECVFEPLKYISHEFHRASLSAGRLIDDHVTRPPCVRTWLLYGADRGIYLAISRSKCRSTRPIRQVHLGKERFIAPPPIAHPPRASGRESAARRDQAGRAPAKRPSSPRRPAVSVLRQYKSSTVWAPCP